MLRDQMKASIKGTVLGFSLVLLMACANTKSSSEEATLQKNVNSEKMSMEAIEPDKQKAALVNVELGLGYLEQSQVARAKTKLTHALKLGPKMPETHSAMAHFFEMVGQHNDAEREFKKAIRYSGNGGTYNNYGAFLCRQGRFKEADTAFHTALKDNEYPRTAEIYENAGICAVKAAQLEKATEYLATAIRRDPNRYSAMLELVDIDLKNGKIAEAKGLLGRYKQTAQPSARSLWLGIQVAKAGNDNNSVASQALMLKNMFEDSPEYLQYLRSEKPERIETSSKLEPTSENLETVKLAPVKVELLNSNIVNQDLENSEPISEPSNKGSL